MSPEREETFVIPADRQGMRLDVFLSRYANGIDTRSVATKLIKEGRVFLNGEVARKGGVLLKAGDRISFSMSRPQSVALVPQHIAFEVLYEDSYLLVVNKPAGMVVHPSKGHQDGTLVNALLAYCGRLPVIGGRERPGIVHRLDKGTSGVLVVAKEEAAHRMLVKAFSERRVKKTYLALVHGVPQHLTQVVSAPIARNPRHRTMMGVVAGGREAISRFHVISKGDGFSLLEVEIETGRTHQIRVHAAYIGHPVVGDALYGRRDDEERFGIERPALHSWRLGFKHPMLGKEMVVTAPLPSDLVLLASILGVSLPPGVEKG